MLDKIYASAAEALQDVHDGATVIIGGFGGSGSPIELISALIRQGARDLVVISNNAGSGPDGLNALIAAGRVRKLICSYPRSPDKSNPIAAAFADLYARGEIELECVPQGNLVERLRAGGSGLGPFFTPTGYGTLLAQGKETRVIDGVGYVLEAPLRGDFALLKSHQADKWGNLTYRYAGRNFAPIMATAATCTVVQANEIVPLGAIEPAAVMTPGIFVKRVVQHA